jgi:hypothetical protein
MGVCAVVKVYLNHVTVLSCIAAAVVTMGFTATHSAFASAPNSWLVGYPAEPTQDAPKTTPPQGPGPADPNKSMSKELQKQNGVLAPPNAGDPDIRKPVPEGFESDMPVITPPTLGKDQTLEK